MLAPVNRLRQLEKKRSQHLSALLRSPPLLKGSLLNLKRPCGRSPCCCEQGELHRQLIISFKKEGYFPASSRRLPLTLTLSPNGRGKNHTPQGLKSFG